MTHSLIPMIVAVLVIMAFRVRRTMTEQIFRPTTVWARIVILTLGGVFVLAIEMRSIATLAGVAGGLVLGLVLAGYSLRHTVVHRDAVPPRYKTNPYIGSLVVVLLVVRILYDAAQARAHALHPGPVNPFSVSWLAALLYFLFVVYWAVYYIGLLRTFRNQSGS